MKGSWSLRSGGAGFDVLPDQHTALALSSARRVAECGPAQSIGSTTTCPEILSAEFH